MKLKYLLLVSMLFLFACRSKKELIQKDSYKETVTTHTLDSIIVKPKLINPDSIKFQMELDLNKVDLFKKLFTEEKPSVLTDSTGQARVYTWIDNDNKLRQKVVIKPKAILVTDTTKIHKSDKVTNIEKSKEIKETIVKEAPQLGFFGKIWAFVKNIGWFIVILILLYGGYKFWNFFNIGQHLKNLIK